MKKYLILLFFTLVTFSFLQAEASKEVAKKAVVDNGELPWVLEVAQESYHGDFITIKFSSKERLEDVSVTLYTPEDKLAKKVKAFTVGKNKKTYVVVLGISIFWKPGLWTLKMEGSNKKTSFEEKRPLIIHKKEFPKEEISFTKKNTAIVKEGSVKKTTEIQKLSEVLSKQDMNAPRYPGPFSAPITATRRTSHFAEARVYKFSDGTKSNSYHWGIDFGIPIGTEVYAPGDGRVVLAENRITTGFSVVLEHAPGVFTLFYHLDEICVKEGDMIKQGMLIAKSGNTGLSTGPHLHWEVQINRTPVSPDALIENMLY